MPSLISQFRTAVGQAAYEAAYQRTLSLWPPEHESLFVNTSFGKTHVLGLGSPQALPLVLIHGFGFSAAQWYPNAPELAQCFRVLAPDVPDQLGLSQLEKPIRTASNYATWLRELIDNLGIGVVDMVGISHGGWLAINYTKHYPERVRRLTVISPSATFAPLNPQLAGIGVLVLLTRRESMIYRSLQQMTTLKHIRGMPIMEQFVIGFQNMVIRPIGFPKVYRKQELLNLTMPVQVLIGEYDRVYAGSLRKVLEAARKRIPHIQTMCIANGGHAASLDQPAATNAALLAFHLERS